MDNFLSTISYNFMSLSDEIDKVLSANLFLLIKFFHFDRAAVFLFDEKQNNLTPHKIVTVFGEMEGEGENLFHASRGSSFSIALNREKPVVCSGKPEYSVCLPMIANKTKVGILRLDNIFSQRRVKPADVKKLVEVAKIFSFGINTILTQKHLKHQVAKLTTLSHIGQAFATTLKLTEILESAIASLVKDLGYDRAQLFLLDETTKSISENISIDFRGTFRTIDMSAGVSPLIESLMYETKPSFLSRKFSSNLIGYVPIKYKSKRTGLLIVDNLFTRQPMTAYDLAFLNILSDQLATVIENSRLFERVEKLSITDSLTGLFNHQYFYERLDEEITRANRFTNPLSLIMLDIDFFKSFNDTYGHQSGDTVLRTVSQIIQKNIRSIDVASRYGGEEIVIILPETDLTGAQRIAERILYNITTHEFKMTTEQIAHITVSMGVVSYPYDATVKSDLVRKADVALYWVKNHGRNNVKAYRECKDI
ncbi:MAG: sensor domain-containing diguanylate cyclase [Endomicrobiales bacterium]